MLSFDWFIIIVDIAQINQNKGTIYTLIHITILVFCIKNRRHSSLNRNGRVRELVYSFSKIYN